MCSGREQDGRQSDGFSEKFKSLLVGIFSYNRHRKPGHYLVYRTHHAAGTRNCLSIGRRCQIHVSRTRSSADILRGQVNIFRAQKEAFI